MKRTSSADQGIYIPERDRPSTPRNATLAKEVIAEAQKLVDMGYNARFTCENKLQEMAIADRMDDSEVGYKSRIYKGSEYDLACQVIEEARKIIAMGYNARIGCGDPEPDKDEREKRKAYYRWKRMNR